MTQYREDRYIQAAFVWALNYTLRFILRMGFVVIPVALLVSIRHPEMAESAIPLLVMITIAGTWALADMWRKRGEIEEIVEELDEQ